MPEPQKQPDTSAWKPVDESAWKPVADAAPQIPKAMDWRDQAIHTFDRDQPNDYSNPIAKSIQNFGRGFFRTGLQTVLHPVDTAVGMAHSMGEGIQAGGMAPGGAYPTTGFIDPSTTKTNDQGTIAAQKKALDQGADMAAHPADTLGSVAAQVALTKGAGKILGAIPKVATTTGTAMQTLGEENLNRRISPSTVDTKYGQSPGRGILSSGIGGSTRKGLLGKIEAAKDVTGGMIGDVVNSADTNANAPALTSKGIRPSIEGPIAKRIGEVTGPGQTTANPEVAYDTFRQSMTKTAPGAKAPIYGDAAPDVVLPSDVWKTTKNIDKNTRFNPDPEVESANEIKRDVRGGLRRQLESVDPNIKPLSRNYGDLSSAETAIERDSSPMFKAKGLRGLMHDTIDSYPVNTAVSSGLYKTGGLLKRIGGVPETPFAPNNWAPKNPPRPLGLPSETAANYGEGDDFSRGNIPTRRPITGQAPPPRLALPSVAGAGESQPMVGVLKHPGAQRGFQPESTRIEPAKFNAPVSIPSATKGWSVGPNGEIVRKPFALLPGKLEEVAPPDPTMAHVFPAGSAFRDIQETPVYPSGSQFRAKTPKFDVDEYLKKKKD